MVESFGSHLNMEMQQRGVEFSCLFTHFDHLRPSLLERMPPIPSQRPKMEETELDSPEVEQPPSEEPADSGSALLLLLGGGGPAPDPPANNNSIENNQDLLDLLGGLDGPSLNNCDIPKAPVNSKFPLFVSIHFFTLLQLLLLHSTLFPNF